MIIQGLRTEIAKFGPLKCFLSREKKLKLLELHCVYGPPSTPHSFLLLVTDGIDLVHGHV